MNVFRLIMQPLSRKRVCISMSIFPPYCASCPATDVVGQSLYTIYIQEPLLSYGCFLSTMLSKIQNKTHPSPPPRDFCCLSTREGSSLWWLCGCLHLRRRTASESPFSFPIFAISALFAWSMFLTNFFSKWLRNAVYYTYVRVPVLVWRDSSPRWPSSSEPGFMSMSIVLPSDWAYDCGL